MLLNALDDAVLVQEMHLVFGGMDIDVHILRSDLQTVGIRKQRWISDELRPEQNAL